jgi:hypothetical protein
MEGRVGRGGGEVEKGRGERGRKGRRTLFSAVGNTDTVIGRNPYQFAENKKKWTYGFFTNVLYIDYK